VANSLPKERNNLSIHSVSAKKIFGGKQAHRFSGKGPLGRFHGARIVTLVIHSAKQRTDPDIISVLVDFNIMFDNASGHHASRRHYWIGCRCGKTDKKSATRHSKA
jgi:hypothetical protein